MKKWNDLHIVFENGLHFGFGGFINLLQINLCDKLGVNFTVFTKSTVFLGSSNFPNPTQELVVKIKACKGTINKTTEKSAIESDQISRFVVFLRHFPVFKRTQRVSPFPIIPVSSLLFRLLVGWFGLGLTHRCWWGVFVSKKFQDLFSENFPKIRFDS